MGRWLRTLGLSLLGLLAGSAVLEVYLRIAEATPLGRVLPVAEVSLYAPNAETGYSHRPGARGMWTTENRAWIEINALGLRDRMDRAQQKPAGWQRLAIAGDSMVEAIQVPLADTFVAVAEHELQSTGRKVEILNLGLAGATPAVLVARLASEAPKLGLDGAVVILNLPEVARRNSDDDSETVGFVPGPDGRAMLGYGFREGRGYRLRSSGVGRGIYWAMDHSRLALVLNGRRNVGWMADLASAGGTPARAKGGAACDGNVPAVMRGEPAGFGNARLEAVLAGFAGVQRAHGARIVVALRGLKAACGAGPALDAEAIARFNAAGLAAFDLDRAIDRHLGGRSIENLAGFGARIGAGHLNETGHKIYARVVLEAIDQKLISAR